MTIKGPQPISAFLSVEKDMNLILDQMLKNERLKRLLFHTTKNCLTMRNLTQDETLGLVGKNIKMVPKLSVDKDVLNYVIINFDNFVTNAKNPEFRDNVVEFDIICHFDQWQLDDFQLRPYKIASEIDAMFNNRHLTGIGELHFLGANEMVLTDEFAGFCLMYEAIHGGEDQKAQTTPEKEEAFMKDYKDFIENLENG